METSTRRRPAQRPGKSKQDYGTPRSFIDAVERRFGPLVWDLAATSANTKVPGRFWSPADDALSRSWSEFLPEGNLWLNPPFENIAPWAKKCSEEAALRRGLILFLTPASIGSNWFAEHIHRKAMVFGLSPRMSFDGCLDPYPKDLALSVLGLGFNGFDVWRWA